MVWILSIIAIIVAVVFWRASLIVVAIIAMCAGGIFLYSEHQEKELQKDKLEKAKIRTSTIEYARNNAKARDWYSVCESDPASGIKILRSIRKKSNDGLCGLSIEKRINGARLTGLHCDLFPFNPRDNILIKFDSDENAFQVNIENYSGDYGSKKSVYISSKNYYDQILSYDDFMEKISSNNYLAIKSHVGDYWFRFYVGDSDNLIDGLGEVCE